MKNNYYYSIIDIDCQVIPFTRNDESLLKKLNKIADGYFSINDNEKNNYSNDGKKVIVLSGNNRDILLGDDEVINMDLLKYINNMWYELYFDYKKNIVQWKELTDKYLSLLDNNSGLYKLKTQRDCYIILTDPVYSFQQEYKIHLSLEYLITYLTSFQNSIFFHSSCAGFDENNCFLFIGKSGYGKSTIARLFNDYKGYVIDDEKNLIKKHDNKYYVFSGQLESINIGKKYNYIDSGICKKIFFLNKSESVMIKKISKDSTSLSRLIKEANKEIGGYPINFPLVNKKIIDSFIDEMITNIPAYNLYFAKDSNVREIFENFEHYLIQGD